MTTLGVRAQSRRSNAAPHSSPQPADREVGETAREIAAAQVAERSPDRSARATRASKSSPAPSAPPC